MMPACWSAGLLIVASVLADAIHITNWVVVVLAVHFLEWVTASTGLNGLNAYAAIVCMSAEFTLQDWGTGGQLVCTAMPLLRPQLGSSAPAGHGLILWVNYVAARCLWHDHEGDLCTSLEIMQCRGTLFALRCLHWAL
jgi:hypothetical protein